MSERKLLSIEVENKSGLDSYRNKTFPGWWARGSQVLPEHSPELLSLRQRLYSGWYTYPELAPELKPLYIIRTDNSDETSIALFVQPSTVRVHVLEKVRNSRAAQKLAKMLNGIDGVTSKLVTV